jgi:hypothetical protein
MLLVNPNSSCKQLANLHAGHLLLTSSCFLPFLLLLLLLLLLWT